MTIAVIGHGRSPEGRGWGLRIDGCNTVLRCWDWQWQPFIDYGDKYDYGLFVLTPRNLAIFAERNRKQPQRGWLAYIGKPTSGPLPDNTIRIDTSRWCKIAQSEMNGAGLTGRLTLTRGCAMAAWAIENAVNEEIVLVGFDNVRCGINQPVIDSFCPDYWALYSSYWSSGVAKQYPIGGEKTATHDMAIEAPLLRKLAQERRVELRFAEDVW